MNIEQCLKVIMHPDVEGGYVNHPKDPGGETKWGISKRAYPHVDIKNLTEAQAAELYREDYWKPLNCEKLPPYLRLMVFDAGINQGVSAAGAMLQAALGLPIDGIIGPKTIERVHTVDKLKMLEVYKTHRVNRYMQARADRWQAFGKGWMRRMFIITFRSFEFLRG